jgi:nitrous oxidase accessory protein
MPLPVPLALILLTLPAPGPVDRPCPAEAEVLRTGEDLTRALARPGARQLWVAGTLQGDFRAKGTLALRGCEGARLLGTGRGSVLELEGDDVVVEDLALERSGSSPTNEDCALRVKGHRNSIRRVRASDTLYGIQLLQCEACHLEDSTVVGRPIEHNLRGDGVKLWESHHSSVRNVHVRDTRDVVVWYSRHVTLEDNVISSGRYGTHFMYAHDTQVRRSTLRGNVVGIFVMYSARVLVEDNVLAGAKGPAGMGIGFKESDAVTLLRNVVVANTAGIYLDFTPRVPSKPVLFQGNAFLLNGVAVRMHHSEEGITFQQNDFRDNAELITVDGGGHARKVHFRGNSWSEYAGYDLDRDGVGDVAFLVKRASSQLRDAHPALRYFHGTAALGLYDAISQAMPYFGSTVLLTDEAPAMRPQIQVPR